MRRHRRTAGRPGTWDDDSGRASDHPTAAAADEITTTTTKAAGWPAAFMVEPRGLEPLTPCLQSRCATNCAMAPSWARPTGCRQLVTTDVLSFSSIRVGP